MSEATKRCPFCGEEILAVAKKCKHCGSALTADGLAKPAADYGPALLAIPVVSVMLIWFWVANMSLLQQPGDSMGMILVGTVVGTAALASAEASRLGMTTNRSKGTYSPTAWFFILVGMWIVGYPTYLWKRKHYGLANRGLFGCVVMVLFLGSWAVMTDAIGNKKAEIRAKMDEAQRGMEEARQRLRELTNRE